MINFLIWLYGWIILTSVTLVVLTGIVAWFWLFNIVVNKAALYLLYSINRRKK